MGTGVAGAQKEKPADLISRRSLIEIVGNRRAPITGLG
jgi:hypothetical protein